MNGFRTRSLFASLILAGLTFPSFVLGAEYVPAQRGASFLAAPTSESNTTPFSGLAAAPSDKLPPPVVIGAPVAPNDEKAAVPAIQPVTTAVLPNISPESIGLPDSNGLGADIWKGTTRVVADALIGLTEPTNSSVLNKLTRQLLTTSAVPPEGTSVSAQTLTSARVERLVRLGAANEAWALTKHAEAGLIDDLTFHIVAENALVNGSDDVCGQVQALSKAHPKADWQKMFIVCQLRAKDTQAAQVALDVFRTQANRDSVFLGVADKNILVSGKTLPFQLTPLTPSTLALLQLVALPLPSELFARADFSMISALLHVPAKLDVAQLALAERAMERGLIASAALEEVYRTIKFSADALASPLTTSESGLRLRALLYTAASTEKDPAKKIALAIKYVQSAGNSFANGAGVIAADMLGDIKAEATLSPGAALVARIYMQAGKGAAALEWLRIAQVTPANADDVQNLWPQFVLGGLEPEANYAADLDKWVSVALKSDAAQGTREAAAATLLLLDAAGFAVTDAIWSRIITAPHGEKRAVFSPALLSRMQTAADAGRKAETILLAGSVAGDGEISLPVAIGITKALREVGFKQEAATFAAQSVASLAKAN